MYLDREKKKAQMKCEFCSAYLPELLEVVVLTYMNLFRFTVMNVFEMLVNFFLFFLWVHDASNFDIFEKSHRLCFLDVTAAKTNSSSIEGKMFDFVFLFFFFPLRAIQVLKK